MRVEGGRNITNCTPPNLGGKLPPPPKKKKKKKKKKEEKKKRECAQKGGGKYWRFKPHLQTPTTHSTDLISLAEAVGLAVGHTRVTDSVGRRLLISSENQKTINLSC